jgi:hypothetical protein
VLIDAAVIWATYAALLGFVGGAAFEDSHAAAFLVACGGALGIRVGVELVRCVRRRGKAEPSTACGLIDRSVRTCKQNGSVRRQCRVSPIKPIARAVLVAAFAVTCVNAVAPAATSASSPATSAATSAAPSQLSGIVVLPTGERLAVPDRDGQPTVLPDRSGHVPRVTIARSGNAIYAIPDEAAPFFGRALDPNLFDITRLATLPAGQVPVRTAFTGTAVPIPGVTGANVTNPSAFGAALARRIAADPATARSASTPFAGVRNITLDRPADTVVHPDFPMVTLTVNAKMPTTGTVLGAFAVITNLDDTRRYDTTFEIPPGNTFNVSVPQGHYAVLGDVMTSGADGGIDHLYFPIVEDATVTQPEQAVTLDATRATASPTFSVPKPSDSRGGFLNLVSFDGQHISTQFIGGISEPYDPSMQILVQPTPAPTHGVLWLSVQHERIASDPAARYTYDLAQAWQHGLPADLHTDVHPAQLATIVDHFHAAGSPLRPSFGRSATFPNWPQKESNQDTYPQPGEVTDYVYGPAAAKWQALVLQNNATDDAILGAGSIPVTYRAGTTHREDWLGGPLGPGFGKSPGACFACRTGDQLLIGPDTSVDGEPTHSGDLINEALVPGVTRIQVFQDGNSIADASDSPEVMVPVPSDAHSYRIVDDVDAGKVGFNSSTQASTEWTVRSSAASGPPIPKSWTCRLSTTERCTVVPFLTMAAPVPTSDADMVRPGAMSFIVTVGHVQHSPATPVTSFGYATSLDGTTYTPARVQDLGEGRYRVTVNTPASATGQPVSVRMQAADAAGSTIAETVRNVYTVEGS